MDFDLEKLKARVSHFILGEKRRKNCSFEDLASEIGIKKGHLNELANEKTAPNIEDLMALKDYREIKFGHLCSYLEDGDGAIEDFDYRTVRKAGDPPDWVRKYEDVPWLSDFLEALFKLPEETRRDLSSKMMLQPSVVRYIASLAKIDKPNQELLEAMVQISRQRKKK